jgi:hypothetical protein
VIERAHGCGKLNPEIWAYLHGGVHVETAVSLHGARADTPRDVL